jgi:peptidyl-prolyl cis-trans isomerase B (cyclophilin B)
MPMVIQYSTPLQPPWRLKLALFVVSLVLPLTLSACAAERAPTPMGCAVATTPCLSGSAKVALQTSRGEAILGLDGKAAPLTAGNFVDLVKRGVYDGTVFHRVVREPMPFVVQGGDPISADPKVAASEYGTGSYIDPTSREARLIPLEVGLKSEVRPRYGQPLTTPGITRELRLSHERGALAMARSGDANSASAQFYVALEALPELDGRYAVFGRVTKGMDVIDKIQQGDKILRATVIEGGTLVQGEP